jgi:hypothetical protein
MNRLAMSPTAAALLRALIGRAGVTRDRILLIAVDSTDWRSLTFTGERHALQLRVPGPDSCGIVDLMCNGIEEAELSIPGAIVADIKIAGVDQAADGSTNISIEALTVTAD